MKIVIYIVLYILTLGFICVLSRNSLRKKQDRVTVGDIVEDIPWLMYVPIANTIILVIIGTAYLVWEKLGAGNLCKKAWNKIMNIEL